VLTNAIYTIEISFESLNLHLDYRCSIVEKIRKPNQTLTFKKWQLGPQFEVNSMVVEKQNLNKDIANNK